MFHHMKQHSSSRNRTLASPDTPYSKSYAVVVSSPTYNDTDWIRVVNALLERHPGARLIVFDNKDVALAHSSLQDAMPRFVAFVCQPDECGREFVAQCHRMMRTLDSDPYIDAMWGIVTGLDPDYALKSIDNESIPQPFVIKRAINFTQVDQGLFEKCFTFSDGKKGNWSAKNCGLDDGSGEEKEQGEEFPKASALVFMEKLNEIEPDLLVTSGHGTEQSVEMPCSTGMLQVEQEGLVPLDEDSEPVAEAIETSSNPKIFLPIGNCLVGHCTGPQCMVTTFLGSMGVRQMCGYTVRTWFGRAGWGTLDLWKSVPGRLTLADAYFLHQARLTYDLKTINPRLIDFKYDFTEDPGYETIVEQLTNQFHLDHANIDDTLREQIYGLCYDRDTFVFYGDPAFIAILDANKNNKLLTTEFYRTGTHTHQFVITFKDAETARDFHLPVGAIFTSRIVDFNIIRGFEHEPILADNFLIILKPTPGPNDPDGIRVTIDFRGTLIK